MIPKKKKKKKKEKQKVAGYLETLSLHDET